MKQITEDYVSNEVGKLLKEKGFDDEPTRYYRIKDEIIVSSRFIKDTEDLKKTKDFEQKYIQAPTQSLALKWLREMHNIFIEINVSIDLNGSHHFNYSILDKECKYIRKGYTSFDWNYEQALEAALLYVLKNLI